LGHAETKPLGPDLHPLNSLTERILPSVAGMPNWNCRDSPFPQSRFGVPADCNGAPVTQVRQEPIEKLEARVPLCRLVSAV
jgi:hypothetical protein